MDIDALLLGVLALLGFAGAFFSGLLGIGGAVIMIPVLYYVPASLGLGQLDMKVVAGISIVQVFFTSVVGVLAHRRNKMVNRDVVVYMGATSLLASTVGGVFSSFLSSGFLTIVFACLALVAALLMLIPNERHRLDVPAAQLTFNKPLAVGTTAIVGALAGMLGAGGGFMFIPLMLYVLGIPLRVAIGSSLGIVFLSSIGGVAGKAVTGQVPVILTAALVIGSMPGAHLGSSLSKRIPARHLRLLLALLITATAIRMWLDVLGGG